MRDLLLGALLLGLLPAAFMRPVLAVSLFAWISLMSPHRFVFGWAYDFNWAMVYGVVATVSVFIKHGRRFGEAIATVPAMTIFFVWTVVTTAFAYDPGVSYEYLVRFAKIVWPVILMIMCIRTGRDVTVFLAVIALSIGFFGAKSAPWVIVTAGEFRLNGPPDSAISDNNHLAVALLTVVPALFWLLLRTERPVLRWALIGVMGGCVLSAISTYSRGGFLTLAVLGLGFLLISRKRLMVVFLLVPLTAGALAFMPDKFWDRINSINEYKEDSSSMERLNTWKANFRIANQRPLGAGFIAYKTAAYRSVSSDLTTSVRAAHSIWFQVLGEHGWIGLGVYVTMLLSPVMMGLRFFRRKDQPLVKRDFVRYVSLSIAAFCVGGTFLSMAYWEYLFYLVGLSAVLIKRVDLQFDEAPVSAAPAQPPRRFGNVVVNP